MDDPYSFLRISQARKEALKSSMDEVRETVDRNPYTLAVLHEQENLPFAKVEASFEFEETIIEQHGNRFRAKPYHTRAWALVDTGADICIICSDLFDIELETHERHPGYFTIQ